MIQRNSERWVAVAAVTVVVAISAAGAVFRGVPLPRLEILGPIGLFAAMLGNAATAAVLLETWRYMPARRAAFALALSFAAAGILSAMALLSIQSSPSASPVLPVSNESGPWFYLFWHAAAAIGAVTYIVLLGDSRPPGRKFLLAATTVAVALTAGCLVSALAFVDHLPKQLGQHDVYLRSGTWPLVFALLAFATLLAFRIPRPTRIDRTLAISLMAITLDIILVSAGGHRFTGSYYASRVLLILGSFFVFTTAIGALVASRSTLAEVEATLSQVEVQAARRADRIRALWQMASDLTFSKDERFQRMLQIAAEAIRPGKFVFAGLSELVGDRIVVVATAWAAEQTVDDGLTAVVYPGAAFPLTRSILSLIPVGGGTRAWNDLSVLEHQEYISQEVGFRSFVASPVRIGSRTYFVTFGSPEVMTDEPYAEDDIAYVDVVASLLASHANQQTQLEQIQFDIAHDALTGLENRAQFHKVIRAEIASGRGFVVALANLDGFRYVNEREGHETGDDVLIAVSAALRAVAPDNTIARMSGDEFGILIRDADAVGSLKAALDRYASVFVEPLSVGGRSTLRVLTVGASIGVACAPLDGSSLEVLVRHAAVALDVAKKQGGTRTTFFNPSMEAIAEETHLRYVELSDAITHDELSLVYQPTFELASRAVHGAEALVRWDHPERGRLSPAEFVDFAEHNGLMGALSRWVFDRVVRDIKRCAVTFPAGFRIYFNLGAQMLDDVAFISHVKDVLRDAPHVAGHLGIEVTETAAMDNVERSMYTIELFRRWGLFVAIDDFGTGHSSLAYLKQLTVDVIKIDRSFVKDLPADERDAALTEMLLRITDRFGFATLAEGIETEAQAAWLLENGCRLGQGYLMARPAPFEELVSRLAVIPALP